MVSTSIKLFDWELTNPIIVASGPFTSNLNSINRVFSEGAGAIVTKTITISSPNGKGGYLAYGEQIFNRDGYSQNDFEHWEKIIQSLRGKKVIGNIFAETPEKMSGLAKSVVAEGIEILELGLSCPTFGHDPICFNNDKLKEFCKAVRKSVDVPIFVKLLLSTSREKNREMATCIKACGIEGVSVSDSLPAIILDKKTGYMKLGGAGGLSGPALKPLVLKNLYDISDIGLITIGIGGIETGQDIIDYFQMGVVAIQVCSTLIKHKINSIKLLENDLCNCLSERNISLKDMKANFISNRGDYLNES